LEKLETLMMPAGEPIVIEIQFVWLAAQRTLDSIPNCCR
jgi:hypothetical protein